jgi:hypothetical protein
MAKGTDVKSFRLIGLGARSGPRANSVIAEVGIKAKGIKSINNLGYVDRQKAKSITAMGFRLKDGQSMQA